MTSYRVEKDISLQYSMPSEETQWLFTISLTVVNPIFCSKLLGYIIVQIYGKLSTHRYFAVKIIDIITIESEKFECAKKY